MKNYDQATGHFYTEHLTAVTTLYMFEVEKMRLGHVKKVDVNGNFVSMLKKASLSRVLESTSPRAKEQDKPELIRSQVAMVRSYLNNV